MDTPYGVWLAVAIPSATPCGIIAVELWNNVVAAGGTLSPIGFPSRLIHLQ